jgi:hypothetical protein
VHVAARRHEHQGHGEAWSLISSSSAAPGCQRAARGRAAMQAMLRPIWAGSYWQDRVRPR